MSEISVAPRWRVLFTPRWLSWHLFAVVAFWGMWWLGDWQLHRALDGNALSWAYTFEWPIFAIFGAVFWVKTIKDELHPAAPPGVREVTLPEGAGIPAQPEAGDGPKGPGTALMRYGWGEPDEDDPPDPELDEYNAYLARLSKEVKGHGKWHGLR
jgi:hypothetical protein